MELDIATNKLLELKQKKRDAKALLDGINQEINEVEAAVIEHFESSDVQSYTSSTHCVSLDLKTYVTVPKTQEDRDKLIEFLKQNDCYEFVCVNSRDLQTLQKRFYKEYKEEDPAWELPGCSLMSFNKLSIKKN